MLTLRRSRAFCTVIASLLLLSFFWYYSTMLWHPLVRAAPLLLAHLSLSSPVRSAPNATVPKPDADGKYTIEAPGIRAQFIPYGASLTNLFVNDSRGIERDVTLGFDNSTYYSLDKSHPHLGGVPGRYANRIKNSTFTIDGKTSNILPNENDGRDTLHGGPNGWDWRNFTVVAYTKNSITFSLFDSDGDQGFPGDVLSTVTYTVTPNSWHFKITAQALTQKTPIMLSSHAYWNLDGFQNPNTATIFNHTLHLPYSGQRIGVDGILIPDGTILPNTKGSVNDFWSAPKQLGADFGKSALVGNCGTNCTGYDNCYLVEREGLGLYNWRKEGPVATLSSGYTGIQLDIYSDQHAFQVYTCSGQNGSLALKKTQGFFNDPKHPRTVQQHGCIVMEVQDWIDAINHPEWHRNDRQIFGPESSPYVLEARYDFSVKKA